jgi:hypothetical protein
MGSAFPLIQKTQRARADTSAWIMYLSASTASQDRCPSMTR